VAANCPANPVSVPATAGTASMDHAGTVELSPEAGRNVLDIRAGIIADQSALKALQAYVKEVCLQPAASELPTKVTSVATH